MAQPRTLLEENRVLREQVEALQRRVNAMQAVDDGKVARLARHFGLPRRRALLLFHLGVQGATLSTQWLKARICKEDASGEAVQVQMSRLRKEIAPIRINNSWGFGYWIEGEDLAAVQAVMRAPS